MASLFLMFVENVFPPIPAKLIMPLPDSRLGAVSARGTGDNYGGEWPVAEFRKYGVTDQLSNKNRSELYLGISPG